MAMKDLNSKALTGVGSLNTSKVQSTKLNNAAAVKQAVAQAKAAKLVDNLRLDNLLGVGQIVFNPAKTVPIKYEDDGKIQVYTEQGVDKLIFPKIVEVPIDVSYATNQQFPVKVEKTVTNIINQGTYRLKSAGLKDRDARIIKIEVLTDKGLIDAIAHYNFVEASGVVTVNLKDISAYHVTKLTFRVYYIYTKTDGSLKFVNKPSEYKKNYKVYGRYKMKAYTYNLSDVTGKTFIKYKSSHPEEVITNPATCNSKTTVGIHTTYTTNPYDIEQWIEKREIYYIPSDTVNPSLSLTASTRTILANTSGTAFFKRNGFAQDNSILTNIPYNYKTILIPSFFRAGALGDTFQDTFVKNDVYESDAIRLLRGDIVNEEVFYNRRKTAMEESLVGLMNGNNEEYSLTDEYLMSNGKDRVYNFAKGFSNMINQEALNVKDDVVNKRALQESKDFRYQVVFEKKAYDSINIDSVNNSTADQQDKALMSYMQFSPTGSRELIERLAEATQYPMNKLYEESFMESAKRNIAISDKTFDPEKNTHLQYYNLTRPKLNNIVKEEYTKTTYDIARDMLDTGFSNLFFKDLYTFKKLSTGVLDSVAKKDVDLPVGDTSVSYKVVYSNSQEEVDEMTGLIRALIKPNDGAKLEVYHGE